ncbi:MAG: hypothetical protein LBJ48_08085 [Coriobacteriales bacterium]|jgi:hypothetical protein|nr:hypothetical protein [Coriobacteriales bacterium]
MALLKADRTQERRGTSQPPHSRAFFLEFLLNMLIFAACAVVALQVFAQGRIATDESAALTILTLDAETLAETYKVGNEELGQLASSLEDSGLKGELTGEGSLVYYYNNQLEISSAEDARYTLVLTPVASTGGPVGVIEIAGYDRQRQLFGFEITQYRPDGQGQILEQNQEAAQGQPQDQPQGQGEPQGEAS